MRVGAHSTSDDPSGYRPADEAATFPLGDPISRLVQHLTVIGEWDDARHEELTASVNAEITAAFEEADSHGSVKGGQVSDPHSMFDDVYAVLPRHLLEQREQVGE